MKFFVISKKPSGSEDYEKFRTDFYYDDSVKKGEAPRCLKCNSFTGMLVPIPPFRVRLETWGIDFGDLAFWMSDFLVTQRFRDSYLESGLSSIGDFQSVEVLSCRRYRKRLGTPPSYFQAVPKIGSSRVDVEKSEIEWVDSKPPECDVCFSGAGAIKRWKRVVIDERSWNGDDVFYPYGLPGSLVVTERFADWAQEHQFKNLILVDALSSSHDFYPMETTNHP